MTDISIKNLELKAKAFGINIKETEQEALDYQLPYEGLLEGKVNKKEEEIRGNQFWNAQASKLIGKRIVQARYMTQKEADDFGWNNRVVVITFDDGSMMYPSMDDEGNDGGSMFGQLPNGDERVYPVLRSY